MKSPRARWLDPTIGAALALVLFAAPATPSFATAVTAPSETSSTIVGEGWKAVRHDGLYVVTYDLEETLPIRSDVVEIWADGISLGPAVESPNGRQLTVAAADVTITEATDISPVWSSGQPVELSLDAAVADFTARSAAFNDTIPAAASATSATELSELTDVADPSVTGGFGVEELEYDFGDRALPLPNIGGIRGEMTGKMYLSASADPRPVVILLHGRHSACAGASVWPCAPGAANIRSYLGYEGIGRNLASNGYNVISVAANAINVNDASLASTDAGAQARGAVVMETLEMLRSLNSGTDVSYTDIAGTTSTNVSFDEAADRAVNRSVDPAVATTLVAGDLVGRFDLTNVGLMGHSRGGEGVVAAAISNQAQGEPFGIRSVLPLAPINLNRYTLPDVVLSSILPFCDGDVMDQQGQRYIDDSRNVFGDDVLRSAVWIMGANHNYFNSAWTPGYVHGAARDDWPAASMNACHPSSPTRLSAVEQYQVGITYVSGFFRSTLGDELQFSPLFDGTVKPTTEATSRADVRVSANAPSPDTSLIASFGADDSAERVRVVGPGQAQVCASSAPVVFDNEGLPPCVTASGYAFAQYPHWTTGRGGPTMPATHYTWNESGGQLEIDTPSSLRDISARENFSIKLAMDPTVPANLDIAISFIDGAGATYTENVSELAPHVLQRFGGPITTISDFILDKTILQQVNIPLSRVAGIDLGDLRQVIISPSSTRGGMFLSDAAFDSVTVGNPGAVDRPRLHMWSPRVEEGASASTIAAAVYIDEPTDKQVTAYIEVTPTTRLATWYGITYFALDGRIGREMHRVVIEPGETCAPIPVALVGNTLEGATAQASAPFVPSLLRGATIGDLSGTIQVREDDSVAGGAQMLPPFGPQGDVCDEVANSINPTGLNVSAQEVLPGEQIQATATGYRMGEAITFTHSDVTIDAVADSTGEATVTVDPAPGEVVLRADGYGSARVQTAEIAARTSTSVTINTGETEYFVGEPVEVYIDSTGNDDGIVEVFAERNEDQVNLGSVRLVRGVGSLVLADGLEAGVWTLSATLEQTPFTAASTSSPLTLQVSAAQPQPESTPSPTSTPGPTPANPGGPDDEQRYAWLATTGGATTAALLAFAALLLLLTGIALKRRRTNERELTETVE